MGTTVTGSKPKRNWIYAKKPAGSWFNRRQWFGYSLLVFFIAAPFIKIGGEPFLLFNIVDRKFVLFGNVFWPQDLHIFVFGMLIAMVCIVLFTVVYGRVWCGWACPQTIFMELIFRRIEYWIEGDWLQQKKLNQGPNTTVKYVKKITKHTVFLFISFLISNIFLAYLIGVDQLWKIMADPVSQHLGGFVSIILFTLVFYGVFAYLREIVCTTICPYGRLQGVLLDDQSITIAYDHRRGEPRGHRRKGVTQTIGDCVDCNLCVQVCPTGIDIRNGLQMECVSCTACIDACDEVMEKLDRPKRLIGFYSVSEIEGSRKKSGNGRAIAYTVVLAVLVTVFGWLIFSRSQVDGTLLRAKGSSYQVHEDGTVSNLYSLELINKTSSDIPFTLDALDGNMTVRVVNPLVELKSGATAQLTFFLVSPQQSVKTYKTDVKIGVVSNGKVIETMKTTFVAPPK
ncbi:cytochrome c oxidase accessory protein CcoG [Parapedobacter indicus]|uniref:Cytochrome c oxidase accessory protein FixG n=1 Tax=Parapedobacter indicus TaxID=1477437 RepID=A0A1I3CHV4_9SPHI|nr:cytochrome c oxidase accessory protein CcoG [Parapedobacter indicus]PPL04251.1 cytochrome c oxidase accessory protein FixG [Parapedobacter indicus]SFH73906.1 cytochrome c oxidase accessory protein FixG [Parapedobacter indicus]